MGDNETPRHGLEHGHEAMQVYAETLCRHALDAQRAIWPAIESIARARSCWGWPAVIEGWAILPDLFFGGPARRGRLLGFSPTSRPLTRRVCMDRDFYRGASDEAALITKFVERSARYDAALEHAARTSNVRMIRVNGDEHQTRCAREYSTRSRRTDRPSPPQGGRAATFSL